MSPPAGAGGGDYANSIDAGAEPVSLVAICASSFVGLLTVIYVTYGLYLLWRRRDASTAAARQRADSEVTAAANSDDDGDMGLSEEHTTAGLVEQIMMLSSAAKDFIEHRRFRHTPIGAVLCLFYFLNTAMFWVELLRNTPDSSVIDDARYDANSNVTKVGMATHVFATTVLTDVTDDVVFGIYVAYIALFIGFTWFVHGVMSFEKAAHDGAAADQSEVYRTAITVFIPSVFLFFIELMRVLSVHCGPIGGASLCADVSLDGRMILVPVVTLMRSLTSFQLWIRHSAHNRSVGLASAALLSLVLYGITVCIFNSQIVTSTMGDIDPAFYYLALVRAILTEIWVFQFVRVGLENLVHCLKGASHDNAAHTPAAAAPIHATAALSLQRTLVDFSVPPPMDDNTATMFVQDLSLTSNPASQLTDSRNGSITAAIRDRLALAHVMLATTPSVVEYVCLFFIVFVLEFVELIVLHTTSGVPGVINYSLPLVQAVAWTHVGLHGLILSFVVYRLLVSRTLEPISFDRYSTGLVMNVFPWVLVIALSVIEAEQHFSHLCVVAGNISRFVVFMALMMLKPKYGNTTKTTWLVLAFALFLWIAITVISVLIGHSYTESPDNVEMLHAVLTEILLFETLSLVLDRYYEAADTDAERERLLSLMSPAEQRRWFPGIAAVSRCKVGTVRGWVVVTLPAFYALISTAIRIATFSGVLRSVSSGNDYIAPRFTDGWAVAGAAAQLFFAVASVLWLRAAGGNLTRGNSGCFVAACLFTMFAAMSSSIDIFYIDQKGTKLVANLLAAVLQPVSDIALVAGGLAVWSFVPSSKLDRGMRVWRFAALGCQFSLAVVHCLLGVQAIRHMKSLADFELFHLLRWISTAFALYSLYSYALFNVQVVDPAPNDDTRRETRGFSNTFYAVLLILVTCSITGAVGREFYDSMASNADAIGGFVATWVDLVMFTVGIVLVGRSVRQRGVADATLLGCLKTMVWRRYTLQIVAVAILVFAYAGCGGYVFAADSGVGRWWVLTFASEMLRIVLMVLFFLLFIPHCMHQQRKRALANAGMMLVVLTRLLTYGLAIIGRNYQKHPALIATMALCDAFVTLHVTAIGGAQYVTYGGASTTAAASARHGDNDAPLLRHEMHAPASESRQVTPAIDVPLLGASQSPPMASRTPMSDEPPNERGGGHGEVASRSGVTRGGGPFDETSQSPTSSASGAKSLLTRPLADDDHGMSEGMWDAARSLVAVSPGPNVLLPMPAGGVGASSPPTPPPPPAKTSPGGPEGVDSAPAAMDTHSDAAAEIQRDAVNPSPLQHIEVAEI